jgi:hypothetical protein
MGDPNDGPATVSLDSRLGQEMHQVSGCIIDSTKGRVAPNLSVVAEQYHTGLRYVSGDIAGPELVTTLPSSPVVAAQAMDKNDTK